MRTRSWIGVVVVAGGLAVAGFGQESSGGSARHFSSMLNVEALIDNYARVVARKYDLSEEQDRFTQEFLREKARSFLDRHEGEVRALVDRMFEVRTGAEMSPEELAEWGKRAAPLFQEAKQLIADGNNEWRAILNEDQKRVHDEDVRLMHESFATTEEKLGRIVTGQMTVDEFRNPRTMSSSPRRTRPAPASPPVAQNPPPPAPPPGVAEAPPQVAQAQQPANGAPSTPSTAAQARAERLRNRTVARTPSTSNPPATGGVSPGSRRGGAPAPAAAGSDPAADRAARLREARSARLARQSPTGGNVSENWSSEWETYTKQFIERYQLNEDQKQKAQSILKDCQEQGQRVVRSKKAEIERLDKQAEELRKSSDSANGQKAGELTAEKTKLLEPLKKIFEDQLKPRLDKLPTRTQRKAAEAAPQPPAAGSARNVKRTPATPPNRPGQPPQAPGQPQPPVPAQPEEVPPEQPVQDPPVDDDAGE